MCVCIYAYEVYLFALYHLIKQAYVLFLDVKEPFPLKVVSPIN